MEKLYLKGMFIHILICFVLEKPSYTLQTCTGTANYKAQEEDELSFQKGDSIDIILQFGNGW